MIFCDMDGVITAFTKQLSKVLGKPVKEDFGNDPKIWSAISRAGTKFWSTMEWLPGSNRLWDELKKFDPVILTSPARHESSIEGKKEWLKNNLPGVPFIIEQDKEKYAAPDAILIDDREKNIKKWEEKGGIGILHKSVPETLIKLADAIQNLDKNVKKAASKGYIKFYKDSSNPKNIFALTDQNVFTVQANKGYPLFEASSTSLDNFRGNVQNGKYLEVPFSRVIDYPTEGEGTTFTPYTASIDPEKFKLVGSTIGDLKVLTDVPNTSSIGSTFTNYKVLKGIREIPMSEFDGPKSVFYAANDFRQSEKLAQEIKFNKEIKPLIIAVDKDGPYILEGAHRYVALYNLGMKSLPALVVIDEDNKRSASSKYKIKWEKPSIDKESEEYFNNAVTAAALLKEGVKFKTPKEFIEKFKKGKVEDLPKVGLQNITTSKEDFQRELTNPEYRVSFDSMKKELMDKGSIELEMPIIVKLNDDKYWGFSGNRRTNLAEEFDIPVKVWMVEL